MIAARTEDCERNIRPVEPAAWSATTKRSSQILLAEDDPEMRSLISLTLAKDGYHLTECSNGIRLRALLIDAAVREDPDIDLVISDIRMRGASGTEVLKSLRQSLAVPPFILITGFGDEETHREARRLGAEILDKPFDLDELMRLVHRIMPPSSVDNRPSPEACVVTLDRAIPAKVSAVGSMVDRVKDFVKIMGGCDDTRFEIGLALHEALTNAVVHGCRNNPNLKVKLKICCLQSGSILLVVRDPGPGFCPDSIPSPVKDCQLYQCSGRGIFLIRQLMDDVRFSRGGREIRMRKKL